MRKKLRLISLVSLAGVATVWLITLVVFYNGKPNPKTDYLAQVNAPILKVPEADRAWSIYRDTWTKFDFCGDGATIEEVYYVNPESKEHHRFIRPTDPAWNKLETKFEDSKELLDCFRAGGKLPALGLELQCDPRKYSEADRAALFPGEEFGNPTMELSGVDSELDESLGESLIGLFLPHLSALRRAAILLTVDSRLAIHQGDFDRVVENVESMMGMSVQAAEAPFLIGGLVGLAIHGIALNHVSEMFIDDPDRFDTNQLERLKVAVNSVDLHSLINYQGEQLYFKDALQRIYTDNGKGDGRTTVEGLELAEQLGGLDLIYGNSKRRGFFQGLFQVRAIGGPASLFLAASRKELAELHDTVTDHIQKNFRVPLWEGDPFENLEQEFNLDESRFELLSSLLPSYVPVRFRVENELGCRSGVMMVIAIHEYRLKHGEWPKTAESLLGEFLDEIPIDRITGDPLKYRLTAEGFTVYSVGSDGDDDGGRSAMATRFDRQVPVQPADYRLNRSSDEPIGDDDWVFWPRHAKL